ncbi:MAG: hypothetical protein DRQ10_05115 [Candidatus Hydrothermota bacterium]|nr:MAG: hypothetical protein DRQ10_05115 [Candidatus Hydrothermae bacterium]
MREVQLYPDVAMWLKEFLKQRHKYGLKLLEVEDTHSVTVAEFLRKHKALKYFPDGESFEIYVDISGIAVQKFRDKEKASLAIIEVKTNPINLLSFAQILGYARVVRPTYAFIISPKGWGRALHRLVVVHKRNDVLQFAPNRHIVVALWDTKGRQIRLGDILANLAL